MSSIARATELASLSERRVLSQDDIARVVARLAHDILDRLAADEQGPLPFEPGSLCLVGIRTGGAHLALRLAERLEELRGEPVPVGLLDITLYRDDVMLGPNPVPVLRGTEIPFDLHRRYLVLVDDVLFTGRTVRAALDALLDLGRPGCVRLAVLVDRGLRELPIGADFVGRSLETTPSDHVRVQLVEEGAAEDEVLLAVREERRTRERDKGGA
jgi:pyrimidine operon attenuation protein / uracil phosphoribosyltransferase